MVFAAFFSTFFLYRSLAESEFGLALCYCIFLLLYIYSNADQLAILFKKHQTLAILSLGLAIFSGISLGYYRSDTERNIVHDSSLSINAHIVSQSKNSFIVTDSSNRKILLRYRLSSIHRKQSPLSFHCKPTAIIKNNAYTALLAMQNIKLQCRPTNIVFENNSRPKNILYQYIEERFHIFSSKSLARAFLLADTDDIPLLAKYHFRQMGIAHLFSASGLHLGLLFFIATLLFRAVGLSRFANVFAYLVCFLFLSALDFRISLLRAFLFLSFYLGLKFLGRKTRPLNILFASAAIIELIHPHASFSSGFILSFTVTFGIIVFYSPLLNLFQFKPLWLRQQLALTASAFLFSSWLGLWLFDYFNFLSFSYNFFLVPLSGVYLSSVLIALLYSPAVELVYLLDKFFYHAAFYSQRLTPASQDFFNQKPCSGFRLQVLLDAAASQDFYNLILLFLYSASLLLILYFYTRRRIWIVRKRLVWISILPLLFFAQLFWPANDIREFYSQPTGIIEYKKQQLSFLGFQKLKNLPRLSQKFTVTRISAPLSIHQTIQESISYSPISIVENQISIKNGIVKSQSACYIFYKKSQPQHWSSTEFTKCTLVYILSYKKNKVEAMQMQSLLSMFGYSKETLWAQYFIWRQ